MVRRNAGPSVGQLADFLLDPPKVAARFGSTPAEVFSIYASSAMQKDPSIAAQLRAQLGMQHPAVRRAVAGTAAGALYRPDAPGAALNGKAGSLGELVQAIWHGNESPTLAQRRLRNALSERVPSAGGFLVPEEFRSDLMINVLEEAAIRPGATVIPMKSLRLNLPGIDDTSHASSVLGGVSFSVTAPGALIPSSLPLYDRLGVEAAKFASYFVVTNETIEDGGGSLDAYLHTVLPPAYAWSEDDVLLNGSSVSTDVEGVLNAPCAVTITSTTSLQADIATMTGRMLPFSLRHFCWVANPVMLPSLLNLYTAIGTPTNVATAPSTWFTGTPADGWTLLGRPVYFTEHLPSSGAGRLVALDRRFVVIGDKMEMSLDSSALGQGYAVDETEFKVIARMGSRVWLRTALTPEHGSNSLSPVIILN